jgi:hypothetical protein
LKQPIGSPSTGKKIAELCNFNGKIFKLKSVEELKRKIEEKKFK